MTDEEWFDSEEIVIPCRFRICVMKKETDPQKRETLRLRAIRMAQERANEAYSCSTGSAKAIALGIDESNSELDQSELNEDQA